MQVVILTDIHPIQFFDEPTCECKTKKDGAGYEDTATLKFLTSKRLPFGVPFGFVITDVNDKSRLPTAYRRAMPPVTPMKSSTLP